VVTLLAAIASTIVAFAAFIRVGRWRDSDDAKRIDEALIKLESSTTADDGAGTIKRDIHKIANDLTKIEVRLSTAERAAEKVAGIEGRLTGIESALQQVASRSDISELRGQLDGVKERVGATAAGVTRIEAYLMDRGGS
jgi:hypothetical protein